MKFTSAFQISGILVLLAGFTAIVAAGAVDWGTILGFFVGLGLVWRFGPRKMARWVQFCLLFLFFAFFLVDLFLLSPMGLATIRFLLALSLYKLLIRDTGADYLIVYLIAFSLLLISATYTISITFLLTSVVYLYFSILALVLFENRLGYEANRKISFSLKPYLQVSTVITSLTVLLSIPIFLAIPRGALGLFGSSDANVSGFSSSVNLGEMGQLLTNPEVVMRVHVNLPVEALDQTLKWRGIALDYFDGKIWTNTRRSARNFRADSSGRFLVSSGRRQKEYLLEQSIFLEPFSDVLFGAPNAVQISGFRNRWTTVWKDGNETFFLRPHPREPVRYFVHSDLVSRAQQIARLGARPTPLEASRSFLQLPELDPRVTRLAREVTVRSRDDFARALRLEAFLSEGFNYTLENPSGGTPDPLAHFLFQSRAGHCEYFSTAMAVMLRSLDIPSRVVNGFRRGEFNDWGEYLIVRQSDAHSWVEAYFPGAGWVDFDPTPAIYSHPGSGYYRRLSQLLDSLDLLWTEVITFDRFKQVGFFSSLRVSLRRSWERVTFLGDRLVSFRLPRPDKVQEWLRRLWIPLLLLIAGLALPAVLYRYRRYLRIHWRRKILGRESVDLAEEYYRELLEALARKGYRKEPHETPGEFGRRLLLELKTDTPLRLAELYYRNRFGGRPVTDRELTMVYASLKQLPARES